MAFLHCVLQLFYIQKSVNRILNPLCVFSLLTVASHTDVIGMLGKDVTLQFIFNCSECNITKNRYFGVYTTGEHKISEYPHCKCLNIYPKNYTVLYNIKNLTMNHSKIYWISLFNDHKLPKLSNKVKLIIQEDNNTSGEDLFLWFKVKQGDVFTNTVGLLTF